MFNLICNLCCIEHLILVVIVIIVVVIVIVIVIIFQLSIQPTRPKLG